MPSKAFSGFQDNFIVRATGGILKLCAVSVQAPTNAPTACFLGASVAKAKLSPPQRPDPAPLEDGLHPSIQTPITTSSPMLAQQIRTKSSRTHSVTRNNPTRPKPCAQATISLSIVSMPYPLLVFSSARSAAHEAAPCSFRYTQSAYCKRCSPRVASPSERFPRASVYLSAKACRSFRRAWVDEFTGYAPHCVQQPAARAPVVVSCSELACRTLAHLAPCQPSPVRPGAG